MSNQITKTQQTLKSPEVKKKFEEVLGKKTEGFVASLLSVVGNSNLKNGSKINIVVTGSDNKDNIYVFNIKKSGNMALVFIIIIVIGIGGVVAYKVITKLKNNNDNGNTGDYDYE